MIVKKYRNAEYTGLKSFFGCRKNIYLAGGNQYWVEYWVEYWLQYWVEYWVSILG